MTLEQKIRNSVNKYEDLFTTSHNHWPLTIVVMEDVDGVLKVEVFNSASSNTSVRYLNGDKFYDTHEEAFYAEL